MRYSLEPKHRKYVQGYSFLSFNRRFGDKYGKKLMDTATKTEIDAAKTASKRVVQKNAEATADLIGNKIADKITSVGKLKNEKNEKEKNYSKKYSKTSGSLWSYYRDEPNNPPINLVTKPPTVDYNADPITNSASFKYKSSIIGKTPNNDNNKNEIKKVKIVVPLKNLGGFWGSLNIPLVNCEISLILT